MLLYEHLVWYLNDANFYFSLLYMKKVLFWLVFSLFFFTAVFAYELNDEEKQEVWLLKQQITALSESDNQALDHHRVFGFRSISATLSHSRSCPVLFSCENTWIQTYMSAVVLHMFVHHKAHRSRILYC